MRNALRGRAFPIGLAGLLAALAAAAPATPRASRKSPHVEIVGRGTVATAPRETVHKNGRRFLEFEITLAAANPTPEQPAGADRHLPVDMAGRVRVVHDLSCGGPAVWLAVGDRIEIQGEYVHVPRDADLIHFTHPADGSCGHGSRHPSGYIRKLPAASTPAHVRPATLVPDQPFTGPSPANERPYQTIVAAREAGTSNEELLAKVQRENVRYSLSTAEIQKLRAAGISENVIEAMLRSGRAAMPSPTPR